MTPINIRGLFVVVKIYYHLCTTYCNIRKLQLHWLQNVTVHYVTVHYVRYMLESKEDDENYRTFKRQDTHTKFYTI
jgi:hypothetical protein